MSPPGVKKDDPILQFFGDYRFLSNFWIAPLVWEGVLWPSSEHAYQAAKCLDRSLWPLFIDMRVAAVKHAGRGSFKVKQPDETFIEYKFDLREDWEDVKFEIMYDIVHAKFDQNPDLKQKLLDTGNAHLEEGNHWNDRIWGVCPAGSGNGKNWLGEILMDIRREFQLGFET